MAISIGVRIDRQTPELDRLQAKVQNPRGFMAAVGKRAEIELRAHFLKRESEPNKSGWPKQHFWNRRIRSNTVLTEVSEQLAVVDIGAPEFAQKLYGGTITPKGGRKFLAIPARSEAYGRSPLSFSNLHFQPTGRGGMLVAGAPKGDAQRGQRRAAGEGAVYYFLVRSVNQAPDPKALPPRFAFERSLVETAREYLTAEAGD